MTAIDVINAALVSGTGESFRRGTKPGFVVSGEIYDIMEVSELGRSAGLRILAARRAEGGNA